MTSAIQVENLGKAYKRYAKPTDRLHEWLSCGRRSRHESVWPVRGVTFDIQAGEAVGVIGQNGAGKTTLMNLIRGIISPSTGSVHIAGSMSALDLGLGFHSELTGRENIYASAPLLGLSADAIRKHIPDIESFAEIGDYLDQSVRTYSSGMRLRLAFSLATAVRPDILVIDEALAVGDVYFQQKCVRRIRSFRDEGSTLLLVSHDQAAIKTLCDRALLLDDGLLVKDGDPQSVLEYYNGLIASFESDYAIRQGHQIKGSRGTTRHGDEKASINRVDVSHAGSSGTAFPVGADVTLRVEGHADQDLDDLTIGILFRDRLGNDVFGTNTHLLGTKMARIEKGTSFAASFALPLNLGVGSYSITASLHVGPAHVYGNFDWWDGAETIQVLPGKEGPFTGSCYIPTAAAFEVMPRESPGPGVAASATERAAAREN